MFVIAGIVALTATSFVGGFFVGNATAPFGVESARKPVLRRLIGQGSQAPPAIKDVPFSLYWEVWERVNEKFLRKPVKDTDLFYGSLTGLVSSLKDPYSVFLPPQIAEKFNADLAGAFEGIGAEIGIRNDQLIVIAPLSDSPAEKAGLRAGDKILQINGEDTLSMTLDEAVDKIRGQKGTAVTLTITRDGFEKVQEIVITRDKIIIKTVVWKMRPDGIALIKLSHFNEEARTQWGKALKEILPKNPGGLILDLRNNPGGFLDIGVQITSEWIPEGVVVIEKFSDGGEQKYTTVGRHRLANIPTVVLVNRGSASASEILAGALQDHGRATLVGEKTFGKGSVQDYEQFGDGSALKITVAEWLTPKGRRIDEHGIEPDHAIEDTGEAVPEDKDPYLLKAVELLQSR